MKVLVLTVSDRASRGVYEDCSGPTIESVLRRQIHNVEVTRVIVPDERNAILKAFSESGSVDIIITTGGTGLSPRDITPEVTREFCERAVPGIAEYLRAESLKQTPNAALSRGYAGMKGSMLIINIPGSVKAAEFCSALLAPLLEHAVSMAAAKAH